MSVFIRAAEKIVEFFFLDEMHVVPIENPHLAERFRVEHDFDSSKSYETVTFIRTATILIASF